MVRSSRRWRAWLGLALTCLMMACSELTAPLGAEPVDVEAFGGIRAQGIYLEHHRVIIDNPFTFGETWETVTRSADPPPTVDFTSQTVIAAGMGARGSSGYRVKVVAAFLDAATLYVVIDEVTLGSGCGLFLAAVTYPMTVVRVDAVARRVEFIERELIDEC